MTSAVKGMDAEGLWSAAAAVIASSALGLAFGKFLRSERIADLEAKVARLSEELRLCHEHRAATYMWIEWARENMELRDARRRPPPPEVP